MRICPTPETGGEILLHRVEAGQSCVLIAACMPAKETCKMEGIAETDGIAAALPKDASGKIFHEGTQFQHDGSQCDKLFEDGDV